MIYGYTILFIILFLALWSLVLYRDLLHIGPSSIIIGFSLSSLFLLRSMSVENLEGWLFGLIILISSAIELMMALIYFKKIK